MTFIKPYREKQPKPKKEITCVRCGEKFYAKYSGKVKYCPKCRGEIL